MAYDVRVLEACRDFGLRCWSVAPELMRHLGAESEIASVDMGSEDQVAGSDYEGSTDTMNLECGVRSNEALASTKDPQRLKYLMDVVGRQGICLRE